MREKDVEQSLVDDVARFGGRALKFVSPGNIGVPDRVVLFPVPEEHQELVSKYIRFVELKAPGEDPRRSQLQEHKRLRKFGFKVHVVDRPEHGYDLARDMSTPVK